jgi:hypothetical protein
MTVISDITTVANATGAGHKYTLVQFKRGNGEAVASFQKRLTGESGTTGTYVFEVTGTDQAGNATTARTNALASLNAVRRHKYAGAPGAASGATVTTWPDGPATAPVVDVN